MKKHFLVSFCLLASLLGACSASANRIDREQAVAELKKIDLEINYTPLVEVPSSYVLSETISQYDDGGYAIENAEISRHIDQRNRYSFARIEGKHEGRPYVHESWTYVSLKHNITCHYYNAVIDGLTRNERFRYETEKDDESWDAVAEEEIAEKNRLYSQMAKLYSTFLSGMDNIQEESYFSSESGSLDFYASNEEATYSGTFRNYWFQKGFQENKTDGTYYSASVYWNQCDISMPNLDFYPLREEAK